MLQVSSGHSHGLLTYPLFCPAHREQTSSQNRPGPPRTFCSDTWQSDGEPNPFSSVLPLEAVLCPAHHTGMACMWPKLS